MAAAVGAALNGHETILYEKNEKLGKKLYITGKGRCNVTNACDTEELFDHIVTNGKFLYSAFSRIGQGLGCDRGSGAEVKNTWGDDLSW